MEKDVGGFDARIAEANAQAAAAESHLADAKKAAAEANAKAEQFRLGIATAEKDAADAKLALEKYKAWRNLTREQQTELVKILTPFAGQHFSLCVAGDPESLNLLKIITSILKSAGWIQIPTQLGATLMAADTGASVIFDAGIKIEATPGANPQIVEIAKLFASTLSNDGITAIARFDPDLKERTALNVSVGNKP
jgi:hypothetical protein